MQYSIGSKERPLHVAIIGSGPSGFYTAEDLFKKEDFFVEVDMFERLPTPYGLVRAGVAPDHQKIKSVTKIYNNIAHLPQFRFWGNVKFGTDITKAELLGHFDAIIYAFGAQSDRKLAIKGENLRGNYSATEFVGWYNGHPDYRDIKFDFSCSDVAIIGMGNVAIDIARILARTENELSHTDIAEHAQDQFRNSKIENIYLIARRGPMQAAFTPVGTKSMLNMEEAAAYVNPAELKLEIESEKIIKETNDKRIIQNLKFLGAISKNDISSAAIKIQFLFRRSPLEIYGENGEIEGIKIVKNELFKDDYGNLKARATDVSEDLRVKMVFRSIGYKVNQIPDVPFDDKKGVIANENGRVVDEATRDIHPHEYVVGWAKRGPTGIIGTNKSDAIKTNELLIEDFKDKQSECWSNSHSRIIKKFLKSKKVNYVPFEDWRILDQIEIDEGEKKSKPREKITSVADMLNVIEKQKGL